ncbi:hypothetical protein Lfu02_04660 [Longispora fulva]|uniref:Uncharacterized protein n=1 Tax=Longispora fulva TaxID=619741 RepID=A0A8J7KJP3_9ACTN|nr:hypothetical protein [Longispora fulva]MBG6135666.1 hypothetical protein [Longispora fulva]GIG56094.1 hypothetical protein Lfu02_04660 [Longispora fulva]
MSSTTLRRAAVTALAAALCATLGPLSPAAAETPGGCAPAAADARSEAPPSCVSVDVTLDRLPAVGESATVQVRLRSQVAIDRATLSVQLPATLRLTPARSGLSTPRAVGLSQVAERALALTTGARTVTFGVTALAAGPAQIEADVVDAASNVPGRSGRGVVLLTVGDRPGGSFSGIATHDSPAVTHGSPAPVAPGAVAAAPGQICAKGGFTVADKTGAWLPGRNIPVAVLGKATSTSATQTFATGMTTATDGTYTVCFAATTTVYQLWVQFTATSSLWRVTNNAGTGTYTVTTAAKSTVPSGTDQAFGTTSPTATYMRGWHAFDTLNLLWFARASSTNCWTARESANCTRITLHWQPGSTDGTYFDNSRPVGQRYVALADADPDSEHLVLHESGHAFMDLLYAGWWPASDCPSPHYLHKRSGTMCAWTEGFANAIAGYIKGDGRFYWPTGQWVDMMNTAWFDSSQPASGTNPENGDQVELRVAGAMIDLWRTVDGGPGGTFDNMRQYASSGFNEWFTADRPQSGLSTSASTRDLVYTHTIDYRTGNPGTGIANGGFESGTANWTITGGVVGNWTSYPAQAGSWYAWMGGNGVANTDTLSQQVAVPSGASATLNYYLRIATAETENVVYDTFKVQVVDGGTTTTLATYSNVNAGTGYVARSVNLDNYRGRTVTLKFVSVEDASLQTDFLLDSLTLATT